MYLNGHLLGNHPYGYTGYSYDITGLAHADGHTRNVLAVVVQNQEPSSRWYSGSGITRHVHLTVVDPVHIARWGTFVTTPNLATTIKSGYADRPRGHPAGQRRRRHHVTRASALPGHRSRTAASSRGRPPTDAPRRPPRATDLRVDAPRAVVDDHTQSVHAANDGDRPPPIIDQTSTTFGIRWLVFDPNTGISLNGHPLKLHGVDLHNDEGALGSVNNYDALWRQMSALKAMGVNAFRTSHNPPSPEMIDVCQKLGIVMMVEAFDAWDVGKLSEDYHLYFNQWSDYDIKEMVNEAKNSPAVIMWSIGNEIPGLDLAAGPARSRSG